tara:strand:+ start:4437 stop:5468 length:1032 start_codon:yes stop_codon:yes gene_type:complete
MANLNIRTPRFFVDHVNYLLSRGVATTSFGAESGTNQIDVQTGSAIELFDMKPLNQVNFDTSADPDGHVNVWVDLNTGGFRTDFVAILNHNMHNADAKVRISTSDTFSEVKAVDHASADTTPTLIEVTGCAAVSTNTATPSVSGGSDNDGHMIVRFTETDDRYIGIQFEGNSGGTFSSTDLTVGCILVGQYFDMPVSPDLSVKRSITFDGVNTQESLGGQRYSTMTNHGRSATSSQNKSPFQTYYHNLGVYGGRMSYDMKFSYMGGDKIMPSAYDVTVGSSETVVEDVWNKTNGSHLPFIFTQDNSSTDESDYMFARFAQDSLKMTQVAPDVFDISMKIEEEF